MGEKRKRHNEKMRVAHLSSLVFVSPSFPMKPSPGQIPRKVPFSWCARLGRAGSSNGESGGVIPFQTMPGFPRFFGGRVSNLSAPAAQFLVILVASAVQFLAFLGRVWHHFRICQLFQMVCPQFCGEPCCPCGVHVVSQVTYE